MQGGQQKSDSRGDQRKRPKTDSLKPHGVDCEGVGSRGEVGYLYGWGERELKKDGMGERAEITWLGKEAEPIKAGGV